LSDSARDCGTVLVTKPFGVKQCIYFMVDNRAVACPIKNNSVGLMVSTCRTTS